MDMLPYETPTYFYLLMEKTLDQYFHVWSIYYEAAWRNQKIPISVSSTYQVRSEKGKKRQATKLLAAITSIHLPEPVSTDLTIKSDSVLTNQIRKDGVPGWLT